MLRNLQLALQKEAISTRLQGERLKLQKEKKKKKKKKKKNYRRIYAIVCFDKHSLSLVASFSSHKCLKKYSWNQKWTLPSFFLII